MPIGIIDYGSGNFASVYNAFRSITQDIAIISDKRDLEKCSHIVLPGVGAFGSAMLKLEEMDILDSLYEHVVVRKNSFLGICLGMQLLADRGYEFGEHRGLGYIKGSTVKLSVDRAIYTLPHMGWNSLLNMDNSPLFKGIDRDATFYFVHSYHFEPENRDMKTVNTLYGREFAAAVSSGNIHGVQFHPEKSQFYGLKVLENFIDL